MKMRMGRDGSKDCTGTSNSANSKAFRLSFWFRVYISYNITGKHCVALALTLAIFWLPVCEFPAALSLLSYLSCCGEGLIPAVLRLLMPIPLWWDSLWLVFQVAQHVFCDWVLFSVHKPSIVFCASFKASRGWRTSHCFTDKSLGLVLVPKKVTNPCLSLC